MVRPRGLLCRGDESLLIIVDIQERLAAAMEEAVRQSLLSNTGVLARAAATLVIPTLYTEQYPKGLGPTEPSVVQHLPESASRIEKTSFSCCGADGFTDLIQGSGRRQVVLAGMEAHVCVLQTALELLDEGREVFVVEDAVCSRSARNHQNAMNRLRQAGVAVASTESVVFEWLRDARHAHFKAVSSLLR